MIWDRWDENWWVNIRRNRWDKEKRLEFESLRSKESKVRVLKDRKIWEDYVNMKIDRI